VKVALGTANDDCVSVLLSRGAQIEKRKQVKQSLLCNLMILGVHQDGALDNFPTLRKYWETHAQYRTDIPHLHWEHKDSTTQIRRIEAQKMATNFYTMLWSMYFHCHIDTCKRDAEDIRQDKRVKSNYRKAEMRESRDFLGNVVEGSNSFYGRKPHSWKFNIDANKWRIENISAVNDNFFRFIPLVAVKAQYDLLKLRESLEYSGFDLAPVSTLRQRSI